MSGIIYLASPYSHPDEAVRRARHMRVCRAAARLIQNGHIVFSPIAHSHFITTFDLPNTTDFWMKQDLAFLGVCKKLYVLAIDGWRTSKGVKAEIQIMKGYEKPVIYIDEQLREFVG